MKVTPLQIVLLLVLAVFAGLLGAVAGNSWLQQAEPGGMHRFVHEELELTPAQDARIDELEESFAVERKRLEQDLRAANARLAQAMESEHRAGPAVAAAIDEVHARMGDLQKATIRHVFGMRALLEPGQQAAFDREVTRALTNTPPE
ncbi:Spy/CpxP family protein refolding chaperone [Altericroceibacterium xinjiangense]|uniref:Spy/CpxP family protein refolding chaperone n=1 Tax=Altericroceibacterium xinjiangense TaxID=762261 RepID=UPI000F7EF7CF|nr:periplasmic heavy metal sensor [Altericroceibacterium xinjiangense]